MATAQYRRFALFTVIGAALWLGFLPLCDWLFAWTEHGPASIGFICRMVCG